MQIDPDPIQYSSFITALGTTWAGNGGTIVGNIRHEAGTISPEDPELFTAVDSAEDGWNVIRRHYNLPEVSLPEPTEAVAEK